MEKGGKSALQPLAVSLPRFRGLILNKTVTKQQCKGMAIFALIMCGRFCQSHHLGFQVVGLRQQLLWESALAGEGSWEAELWLGCCSQMEAKSPACGPSSSHLPHRHPGPELIPRLEGFNLGSAGI